VYSEISEVVTASGMTEQVERQLIIHLACRHINLQTALFRTDTPMASTKTTALVVLHIKIEPDARMQILIGCLSFYY